MNNLTFYNEPELKESLIELTKEHQRLDMYIRGQWIEQNDYPSKKKGCFYGCMTQSKDNTLEKASELYGIPILYVCLTEKIYENLPELEWKNFPYEAINVLPVGVDLNPVYSLFFKKLLTDQLRFCNSEKEILAIKQCIEIFSVPFDKINKIVAANYAAYAACVAEAAAYTADAAADAAYAAYAAAEAAYAADAAEAAYAAADAVYYAAGGNFVSNYYPFIKSCLFDSIKESYEDQKIKQIKIKQNETRRNKISRA